MTQANTGPKTRLTRELLVATALRVADDEGLEALSMRRLGRELGVDPMAAYRHLPNKKALLAGVVEAVVGGTDVTTDEGAPWQERFRQVVRAHRDSLLAHSPAVARLAANMPLNSPQTLGIVETAVAILTQAGVPLRDAIAAIQSQAAITAGIVMSETFWREQSASGSDVHLAPPVLPLPGLPLLDKAAEEGDFGTPSQVFEFCLDALVARLETLAAAAREGAEDEVGR